MAYNVGVTGLRTWVTVAAGSLLLLGCAARPAPAPTAAAAVPLATKPTVGQEIGAVAVNKIVITFPQGGYRLSREANRQLDLAARLFRDVNPVSMFSMGYTDPQGTELGNISLSARRAFAVKQGLVARGIPSNRVLIQAFGESDPVNADQPDSPENRRVVIQWRIV